MSRAETRTGSPRSCTKHRAASVVAPTTRGRANETANRHRRRTPARWCRRQALPTLHCVVQGVAVGNIDERAATAEPGQGGDSPPLSLRAKQQAKRTLDQLRHCAALTRGLALELGHYGIVDVESGLHMENHIMDMVISLGAGP